MAYVEENATLETARQYLRESLQQFVTAPAEGLFEQGHLAALYVIGREALGMDLDEPPMLPDGPEPRQTHLRVVK